MSLISDSFALYKREMIIFRANLRQNIIRSAIFPLFIILLFGNIGSTFSGVPVAVVNYANNPQSAQFIDSLGLQGLLHVKAITTETQAFQLLNSQQVNFVIVILPGFPSTNSSTPTVHVYYSNLEFTVTQAVLPSIQQRASQFTSSQGFQSQVYEPPAAQNVVTSSPVSNANGNYKNFLFSGVIGMVLVFSALFGGGISLITDRLQGSIKSFLVAPINKSSILLGRLIAAMVQSVLYVLIVLIIGVVDGSTIAMGWIGLFWIFLLGMVLMVCFTSVSAIIASRLKNVNVYAIFSQAIGLPLWFLSGGIFPVTSLPKFLQALSVIDPMTYALDGFRWVVLQGTYPIPNIISDFGILLAFTAIVTALSIYLFKSTIE